MEAWGWENNWWIVQPSDDRTQVDINQTTANPLAQIVHRSRALEFAKSLG